MALSQNLITVLISTAMALSRKLIYHSLVCLFFCIQRCVYQIEIGQGRSRELTRRGKEGNGFWRRKSKVEEKETMFLQTPSTLLENANRVSNFCLWYLNASVLKSFVIETSYTVLNILCVYSSFCCSAWMHLIKEINSLIKLFRRMCCI